MAWVGAAAGMAVAVLACRQLVGIGDDPPQGQGATSTDAGAEGGFTYGQGACAACVTTSCDAQATACAGTPSCAALEGCMSGCGTDPTCRAQCGVDHGLGNDGFTPAFEACLASSCADACGLTCGGLAAVFPPATATGCESCIAAGSECSAVTACAVDPDCQKAVRCQFSSHTFDVQQACPAVTTSPGGVWTLSGPNSPIASTCSSSCSWGADWSCLGKVDWPSAATGTVTTTVRVYDYDDGTPIEGVTVTLCNTTDPLCTPFLDRAITDDAGTVILPLQQGPVSPRIFISASSQAVTPVLGFIVSPLSQPNVTVPMPTLPAGVLPAVALQAGVTLDPALGMVVIVAYDCRLAPAPGMTFDITPKGTSTLAYLEGPLPVVGATSTDSSGSAVFANVEADTNLTITMTSPAGAAGAVQLFARGDGGLSYVGAPPTH